jgi:hypothetical protein
VTIEVAVFTNLFPLVTGENELMTLDRKAHVLTVKTDELVGNYLSSVPAPDDPFGADIAAPEVDIRSLGKGSQWKVRARNPIMRSGTFEWYVLIPVDEG